MEYKFNQTCISFSTRILQTSILNKLRAHIYRTLEYTFTTQHQRNFIPEGPLFSSLTPATLNSSMNHLHQPRTNTETQIAYNNSYKANISQKSQLPFPPIPSLISHSGRVWGIVRHYGGTHETLRATGAKNFPG